MTTDIQFKRSWRVWAGACALALMLPVAGFAQDAAPIQVDTMRLTSEQPVTMDTFFGTVQASDMLGLSYEAGGCVVEVSDKAKRARVASAGQVLVRLDDKRSMLALRTAESRVAELAATIEERELDIQSAIADDKRRQQELDLTTAEYERNSTMLGRGLINETTMEGVERRFMEAQFAADRAQEAIATARAAKRRAEIAHEIGQLDLQTAQLNHEQLVLTAPIDGVLVGFETNVGDCVSAGERAAQIYAPSEKSVDVFILISRLSASGPAGISDGSAVRITRVNGQVCAGTITRFDTEADLENQFVKATIEVDETCAPDLFLNEAVEVEAMLDSSDDTFEIPTGALTNGDTVFLVDEEGATLQEVVVEILKTGPRETIARIPGGAGRLIVSDALAGLGEGQTVALR
ncbi:HlyD family efflux transporter periplasmic adaptor subunit [uncultured Mameliella sp.]|uniref:efflux RND transporter periplasmic adaptor subunit n=1 Tax=uncultured Mameliella sp. TaxID=1447087 RepID=UPI002611B375|nr:HlyD family efflux transporter periplasmic adaptor subunit [uncultured Mameliella sp.]